MNLLECIQKRAVRIICPYTDYHHALRRLGLSKMAERQHNICKRTLNWESCCHQHFPHNSSRTFANGHLSTMATFFSSRRTKNPYIDSCLKPLYNGHLFTTATFFCPQGVHCREVQLRDTQRQFSENICSEDDLRSRIFGTFVVKSLTCMPLLGFSII